MNKKFLTQTHHSQLTIAAQITISLFCFGWDHGHGKQSLHRENQSRERLGEPRLSRDGTGAAVNAILFVQPNASAFGAQWGLSKRRLIGRVGRSFRRTTGRTVGKTVGRTTEGVVENVCRTARWNRGTSAQEQQRKT